MQKKKFKQDDIDCFLLCRVEKKRKEDEKDEKDEKELKKKEKQRLEKEKKEMKEKLEREKKEQKEREKKENEMKKRFKVRVYCYFDRKKKGGTQVKEGWGVCVGIQTCQDSFLTVDELSANTFCVNICIIISNISEMRTKTDFFP